MNALRALWRFAHAVAHALRGYLTIVFLFPRLRPEQQHIRVQLWARRMLQIMGITLDVAGSPPAAGPVLLVANHISWLDILVMHAARHCRFVGKSEIRGWPLVGTLATGAGTMYIQRASKRDAGRLVRQMSAALKDGDVMAVFPEGTTGDGRALLPFHSNLLQSAVVAASQVQPVALRFVDGNTGATSFAPSFVGDDTLLGSLWQTMRATRLVARVTYGELRTAQGHDRRSLSRILHAEIEQLRQR